MNPQSWQSSREVPWPYQSEFTDGPIVHHLPYVVTWAVMLAGRAITALGVTRPSPFPEKLGVSAGPDLCTLILEHASGCTSRLTIGALAPRNRSLLLVGTDHVVRMPDVWATDGPLFLDDEQILEPTASWPFDTTHRLDFSSGVKELVRHSGSPEEAAAYTDRCGGQALHVLEICAAFHRPGSRYLRLSSG
jgi:predicted dehydrogenase